MTIRTAARVPAALIRRGRVLRPRDAEGIYAHPRPEFARLEHSGALHRLADGYYAVVPDDQVGQHWLPALDAVALGVATAGGHLDGAALMGISAARAHEALPRALNVAVVAANRHRGALVLTDRSAQVHFVRRDVARLDLQRHRTELGSGWVTTAEQTVLDLAARPDLGGVPDATREAIGALLPRCDTDLLRELARTQRKEAALRRLLTTPAT